MCSLRSQHEIYIKVPVGMAKSKPIDYTQHYKQEFTVAPMLQIQFF